MRSFTTSLLVTFSLAAVTFVTSVPASAQSVTQETLTSLTTAGPISECPLTVNFSAAITMSWPSSTPIPSRQIQYKWINSEGIDQPTQTALFFVGAPIPLPLPEVKLTAPRAVGAGAHWVALQITYPINHTLPQLAFNITCPAKGTLSFGNTGSPGSAAGIGVPPGLSGSGAAIRP